MITSPTPYLRYLLLLSVIVLFSTCKKDDVIPSYIYIPAMEVHGNTGVFGSNSSKITDAWVYFEDGNLQGAYQLPCTFPIRATGPIKLRIIAGVMQNGVAATRIIYPFYTDTLVSLNLQATKTDTIRPTTIHYFPNTKFALGPLDFETGNPFQGLEYTTNPSDVFEGRSSAKLTISDSTDYDFAYSDGIGFQIPATTGASYLEFNYKNDVQFTASLNIGITGYNDSLIDLVTMTPHDTWNKIYINLTPKVLASQGDYYKVIFYVKKDSTTQKPNIFIDNVKVIYF